MSTILSTQTQQKVTCLIGQCIEINEKEKERKAEKIELEQKQKDLYKQISYKDLFLYYLPTFIGKTLSSNYDKVSQFYEICAKLRRDYFELKPGVDFGIRKNEILSRIFSAVIADQNITNRTQILRKQFDLLIQLELMTKDAINVLNKIEKHSLKTSSEIFIMLKPLNEQIHFYNELLIEVTKNDYELSKYMHSLEKLPEIGEEISSKRGNQTNFKNMWDQECSSYSSSALKAIDSLEKNMQNHKYLLNERLYYEVCKELCIKYPEFVHKERLYSSESLYPAGYYFGPQAHGLTYPYEFS